MVDVEDDVTDTSPLTMSSLSTTRTTTTNFSTDDNGDDDVLPEAKVTGLMRDLKKKDAIIENCLLNREWKTYIPARTPV
jgi:hypothetical protein